LDKAHRQKIALVNQQTGYIGWFLGIGFDYSEVEKDNLRLADEIRRKVDTSKLPEFVANKLVNTINLENREVWGWTPRVEGSKYLIHEDNYGALDFVSEVNELVQQLSWWNPSRKCYEYVEGIIYFAGHGGYGRLIGFVKGSPSEKITITTFGMPRSQGLQEEPDPDVPYTRLTSLLPVRLIYLSACETCKDPSGTGLVAALANMVDRNGNKIGAKAVVGYHIPLAGLEEPPNQKVDPVFWGKLTGKIVEQDERGNWTIRPDPEGAGNVEQAATAAAKRLASWWRVWFGLVTWKTYMGIAGRNGQQDALGTVLY